MVVVRSLVGVVAAGVMVNAVGGTNVVRPGPCASQQASYLLAANSAALVKVEPGREGEGASSVIVFRRQATAGWASQRLLRRFDLKLDEDGPTIVNSGAFCVDRR